MYHFYIDSQTPKAGDVAVERLEQFLPAGSVYLHDGSTIKAEGYVKLAELNRLDRDAAYKVVSFWARKENNKQARRRWFAVPQLTRSPRNSEVLLEETRRTTREGG